MAESIPSDLQQIVSSLARNEENLQTVMAGLNHQQLNWQPDGGKAWSVLQCIEHLTLSNAIYIKSMTTLIEGADHARWPRKEEFRSGVFARLFVAALEPPVKLKVPAPKGILPASTNNPEDVLSSWLKTHETLRKLIRSAAPMDLGLAMPHPFFSRARMKFGTALLILPAHERRHIWQAGKVKEALKAAGH